MNFDISIYNYLYEGQVDVQLRQQALQVLDDNELQRFKKFKAQHAAQQYLLGRLLTKTAAAELLNIPLSTCSIALSQNGKPSLANYPQLHFSVSHCDGAVMVAFARQEIGVDVERIERFARKTVINDHFFSPLVINNIEALVVGSAGELQANMLAATYWTAMEAVVKLEDSSIFTERTRFAMLLDASMNYKFARGIALASWQPHTELVASVAIKNSERIPLHICYKEYPGDSKGVFSVLAKTAELSVLPTHQN